MMLYFSYVLKIYSPDPLPIPLLLTVLLMKGLEDFGESPGGAVCPVVHGYPHVKKRILSWTISSLNH